VIRPSYVLGGRAMEIVYDEDAQLRATCASGEGLGRQPGADRLLSQDAIEVDVDALADGTRPSMSPASWSISRKPASIRATAPARCRLFAAARRSSEIARQTEALAKALKVVGLMNVQFAVKDGDVYVLEVNPRASRTVPFVAKATGQPIAKIAARVMAGEKLKSLGFKKSNDQGSRISRSRRRCSRSPASPVSTSSSGPRCARPAKSWAST
jgi:carbamoyl-phosphate synthase large subunit